VKSSSSRSTSRAGAGPRTAAPPINAEASYVTAFGPARRLRVAAASVGAAVLGAAPHVLHHAGLLAGAALFAGFGGTLLFGALGLVATIPLLLKMRRTGSWRPPAAALALFATLFALSSFVVAPALTGANGDGQSQPTSAPQRTDGDHNKHHP